MKAAGVIRTTGVSPTIRTAAGRFQRAGPIPVPPPSTGVC